MTFALTKVQAYGIEAEEALNKRYRQYMVLTITAAATDTALDLGTNQTGSLGTFWTAVGSTAPGSGALLALQDIVTRADYFDSFGGNFLDRAQGDAASILITALNSGASTGGAAAENLVLTGAATTDTVLGATIVTSGATAAYLQAAASSIATSGIYPVTFSANPGTGAVVRVAIKRAAGTTTPEAGQYFVSYANKTPNITFSSGDAPTAYAIVLKWILQPQTAPVEYYAST